jgi:hypothetical protein
MKSWYVLQPSLLLSRILSSYLQPLSDLCSSYISEYPGQVKFSTCQFSSSSSSSSSKFINNPIDPSLVTGTTGCGISPNTIYSTTI